MKKPYLECGKIINTHGVKGVLKLESYCDSPKVLASLSRVFFKAANGNYTERKVRSASVAKGFVLASLEGIDTLEDAVLYREKTVYALREDIPLKPGAVLLADMISLPVYDAATGVLYGKVKDITDSVASRLIVIETDEGKEVLLPDIKEFVKEISVERGVFITPIPGFFD